jgi:hypothetical protein
VKAWTTAALVLALALIAAALALRPPPALHVNALDGAFSAGRAMADVRAIAQKPHPMGSPEIARVQAYVLGRMTALGLSPEARPFASGQGSGQNLLGVLPGADRSAPALLLMAHADSVPAGPGAADDGAGVAAVLETLRALKTSAPLKRDVMVLITDGEERCLCGSRAFFTIDPARARVGMVINLEARGNRGRAAMFETHRNAAPMISLLADANALGGASSLMPDIYRALPNDTDLSPALKHGYAGMNFAFFGGVDAYHHPADTPEALDPASLQHIGDQVLRAARALAGTSTLPARAPDQVYADLLGGPVLQYPAFAAWALLLLAVAGVAISAIKAVQERQASVAGLAGGAGAFLALLALLAAVLAGDGVLRAQLAGGHLQPLLRNDAIALAGMALLALGVCLVWLWAVERWLRPASLAFGGLNIVALLAMALQVVAPLDAFIPAWPLVLAVIGLILTTPARPWLAPLFALAAIAQTLYWAGLVFALVGQTTPVALAAFTALAAMPLLPLLPRSGPKTGLAGSGLMLAGLAASLGAVMA